MLRTVRRAAAAVASTLATACLPYTVASTAHTVAPHEVTQTTIAYLIPGGIDVSPTQPAVAMPGVDYEARYGLDDRSDVGIRVPSYSGLVANYKRRITGDDNDDRSAATAIMVGAGVVNWAEHAHAELTLLASGAESWTRGVTPYGGLRVMQVAPIARHAVHDTPTAGGFFGLRIGDHLRGISPEIGIYHDRSALGLRRRSIVVVPALSVYGGGFLGLPGRPNRHRAPTGGPPRRPLPPPILGLPRGGATAAPATLPMLPPVGRPAPDARFPRPNPAAPYAPRPAGVRTARPA